MQTLEPNDKNILLTEFQMCLMVKGRRIYLIVTSIFGEPVFILKNVMHNQQHQYNEK